MSAPAAVCRVYRWPFCIRITHHLSVLDSNGKKTRFLFQVKTELGLDNMASRHVRVEAWRPDQLV